MLVDKPMFKVKTNIMTLRIFKVKKKQKPRKKKRLKKCHFELMQHIALVSQF